MSKGGHLTLEQKEAKFALECVENAEKKSYAIEYHRLAKRIPAMILSNGLGPTMTFIKVTSKRSSDSDNAAASVYSDFVRWLCEKMKVYPDGEDLLKSIISSEMYTYFEAQDFALRFATWLSRLADAYLPKEASN